MSLSFLLLQSIIITVINSQCTDKTITCTSYEGTTINNSIAEATCKGGDDTEILVSCGIKILNNTSHKSKGIEMTDNKCIINFDPSKSNQTDPIPIARCCDFTTCFEQHFSCDLKVTRTRSTTHHECDVFPHLLSCTVQANIFDSTLYQGIWFSPVQSVDYQMRTDYCSLFPTIDPTRGDCATPAPSYSPSKTPTNRPTEPSKSPTMNTTTSLAPTENNSSDPTITPTISPTIATTKPTSSPTILPSNLPSFSPSPNPSDAPTMTSDSPTLSPTQPYYVYEQSSEYNYCTLERHEGNTDTYLWLYGFCCITTDTTFSPTASPTLSPTPVPTNGTGAPSYNIFSDSESEPWRSESFPLGKEMPELLVPTPEPTSAFSDIGDGIVEGLHWGVSNIYRNYTKDSAGAITSIMDTPLDEYYFTIKNYKLSSGIEFDSEYGSIYLPDQNQSGLTYNLTCPSIPVSTSFYIVSVHVYINEKTDAIEGMTMTRLEQTCGNKCKTENYTCHIAMAEQNDNSMAFQMELYTNDTRKYNGSHTVDVSECGSQSGLAGFIGYAPGFGIENIQFEFVAQSQDSEGSCPVGTTTTTTTSTTTLEPSPSPTNAPTPSPVNDGTPEPTQTNIANIDFKCYWVMSTANDRATCDNDIYPTDNKAFMTNCIGYSIDTQPNSWYISHNDECIVDGFKGNKSQNIVAIATCCYLENVPIEPTVCEREGITWTSNGDICKFGISNLFFGLILFAVIVVFLIWAGFIAFCVMQNKKIDARKAKEKRLKAKPNKRKDKDGDTVALYTEEQIKHRLALEHFKVDEEVHKDMVKHQKMASTLDIGLR